jgi:hypothetical protein
MGDVNPFAYLQSLYKTQVSLAIGDKKYYEAADMASNDPAAMRNRGWIAVPAAKAVGEFRVGEA